MKNLSLHFTLRELTRTSARVANDPTPEVLVNLTRLCEEVLEPMRYLRVDRLDAYVGGLRVNSGYRSPEVNAIIGGEPKSAHIDGRAADVEPTRPGVDEVDLMAALVESEIPFDKAIYERRKNGAWVHVQIRKDSGPARRVALMSLEPGSYVQWDAAKL